LTPRMQTTGACDDRQSVDLQLAEIVLKDLIPEAQSPQITTVTIMAQTASYFGLSIEEMAERQSIYAQVTELTNRIKQQASTG